MDFLLQRRRMMMRQAEAVPIFYDYITNSGTVAFVDTGYILPENAVIVVTNVFGISGSNRSLCGVYDGTYSTRIIQQSAAGSNRLNWIYDGGTAAAKNVGNFYHPVALMGSIWMSPSRGGRNDTVNATISKGTHKPNSTFHILATAPNDGLTRWQGKIGAVYIYGSDAAGITGTSQLTAYTPVASFIPCKYKGQSGFWFVEEDRFCGKFSTGTLTVSN